MSNVEGGEKVERTHTRYIGKDLWIPMVLVLFAYCIAGVVHAVEQPTQFTATPLSAQGSYGDEHQACSSRVLQLSDSAEILPRVTSEREQEAASKNNILSIIECSEILR